jgi:hypothetical protein
MGNSIVEHQNRSEKPNQWDRYLAPLVFALRSTPHASTGFIPFELMLGRKGNNHFSLLKELWSGEVETPEIQCEYQYVLELRNRIKHTCKLAKEMIEQSHEKNKKLFDKKAKMIILKPGDQMWEIS